MLGSPEAAYNLAVSYYKGEGVTKNYSKAIQLFQKAAAKDLKEAQFKMDYLYDYGHDVKQNYHKAYE